MPSRLIQGLLLLLLCLSAPSVANQCLRKLSLLSSISQGRGWASNEVSVVTKDATGGTQIDGVPATEFRVPKNHDPGLAHEKMYEISRNGKPRLIKILRPYLLSDDPLFDSEVNGMKLAGQLGGPEIYRVGTIILSDGKKRRFIEMEKLFPNDMNSRTLKGLLQEEEGLRALSANPVLYRKMAELLLEAFAHRTSPLGADLIFSGESVAWIDTGGFKFYGGKELDPNFVLPIKLITWSLTDCPEGLQIFQKAFLAGLRDVKSLSPAEKANILLWANIGSVPP